MKKLFAFVLGLLLIVAAVLPAASAGNAAYTITNPYAGVNWKTVIIPITVALRIYSKIPYISNPIIFIVMGAIGGYLYYLHTLLKGNNGNNNSLDRKEAADA